MAKITTPPREYVVTLNEDEFRLISYLVGKANSEDDSRAKVPKGTGYDLYRDFSGAE